MLPCSSCSKFIFIQKSIPCIEIIFGPTLFCTLAFHPLIREAIKYGATLVADGGSGLVVVFDPGMGGARLFIGYNVDVAFA